MEERGYLLFADGHKEYFEETCGKIIATRENTVKALRELGYNEINEGKAY